MSLYAINLKIAGHIFEVKNLEDNTIEYVCKIDTTINDLHAILFYAPQVNNFDNNKCYIPTRTKTVKSLQEEYKYTDNNVPNVVIAYLYENMHDTLINITHGELKNMWVKLTDIKKK